MKKQKARRGASKSEDRLPPVVGGTSTMAVGFFPYGWTAQYRIQWMAPIVGTALQGFGLAVILVSTQTYLLGAFPMHAGSASATGSILGSTVGAVVPLAAPPLYSRLGLGWGNSLLGFTALAFLPDPLLLSRYGDRAWTRLSSFEL